MNYIKASLLMKQLIADGNEICLAVNKTALNLKNIMFISDENDTLETIPMDSYTDEFVKSTLDKYKSTASFVITDVASMDVQGKNLTYFLYKAYNKHVEKGLVYYQVINPDTLEAIGDLQFSNAEENIFFKIDTPKTEESSCNAMETGEQTHNEKKIAFLIGHNDEERLYYDIERLIVDTANNVQKNQKTQFTFIIQVSTFGKNPSDAFKQKVNDIAHLCTSSVKEAYPNCTFIFEWGE